MSQFSPHKKNRKKEMVRDVIARTSDAGARKNWVREYQKRALCFAVAVFAGRYEKFGSVFISGFSARVLSFPARGTAWALIALLVALPIVPTYASGEPVADEVVFEDVIEQEVAEIIPSEDISSSGSALSDSSNDGDEQVSPGSAAAEAEENNSEDPEAENSTENAQEIIVAEVFNELEDDNTDSPSQDLVAQTEGEEVDDASNGGTQESEGAGSVDNDATTNESDSDFVPSDLAPQTEDGDEGFSGESEADPDIDDADEDGGILVIEIFDELVGDDGGGGDSLEAEQDGEAHESESGADDNEDVDNEGGEDNSSGATTNDASDELVGEQDGTSQDGEEDAGGAANETSEIGDDAEDSPEGDAGDLMGDAGTDYSDSVPESDGDDGSSDTEIQEGDGSESGSSGGEQESEEEETALGEQDGELENKNGEEIEDEQIVEIDVDALRTEIEASLRNELEETLSKEIETRLRAELYEEFSLREPEEVIIVESSLQRSEGFEDSQCTLLSDNEFYCFKKVSDNNRPSPGLYREFFSGPDELEGDMEIFVNRGGQSSQLTYNNYDDVSVSRDRGGGLVVWQGQVNDVWQIFVYNERTGVTTQLTQTEYNNISPRVRDGVIAWQAWPESSWDIFIAESGDGVWTTRRITETAWPDIEPKVAAGYVMWQSYVDNTWQVFTYDIVSGREVQISSGVSENRDPRLAILWEKTEGGDTETFQYDLSTGTASPLGENYGYVPRPFNKIPEPPTQKNDAAVPAPSTSSSGNNNSQSGKNEGDDSDFAPESEGGVDE